MWKRIKSFFSSPFIYSIEVKFHSNNGKIITKKFWSDEEIVKVELCGK